jgi:hypothetical protein
MEWWWNWGVGATVCVATEGFDAEKVEKRSIHEFLKLNPFKPLRRFVKR